MDAHSVGHAGPVDAHSVAHIDPHDRVECSLVKQDVTPTGPVALSSAAKQKQEKQDALSSAAKGDATSSAVTHRVEWRGYGGEANELFDASVINPKTIGFASEIDGAKFESGLATSPVFDNMYGIGQIPKPWVGYLRYDDNGMENGKEKNLFRLRCGLNLNNTRHDGVSNMAFTRFDGTKGSIFNGFMMKIAYDGQVNREPSFGLGTSAKWFSGAGALVGYRNWSNLHPSVVWSHSTNYGLMPSTKLFAAPAAHDDEPALNHSTSLSTSSGNSLGVKLRYNQWNKTVDHDYGWAFRTPDGLKGLSVHSADNRAAVIGQWWTKIPDYTAPGNGFSGFSFGNRIKYNPRNGDAIASIGAKYQFAEGSQNPAMQFKATLNSQKQFEMGMKVSQKTTTKFQFGVLVPGESTRPAQCSITCTFGDF